jgi:hypothetical protein
MTRRNWFAIAVLFLIAFPLTGTPASAEIPSFARKYGVSCNLCHNPAPRLTAFGEQFAANGFELTPGEQPRDTLDTGDPLLRLLRNIDIAFRFDAYASLSRPIGREAAALDLQTPYNIKVLSGGPIANRISYYLYFFLSERGEVAGLEDAYIQFTDIGGSGVSVIGGQFQVSDPLFKRELRLHYEDYQPYRVRVGNVGADLTYDRGLFATYSPWQGGDLALILVNGQGLREAGPDRLYDRDPIKNVALRYSQDVGPVRLGGFGYWGRERADGQSDRILMWGPDATVSPVDGLELNLQYLRREDTNPLLEPGGPSASVNSAFGEAIIGPFGPDRRWFATGLYNWVSADRPLVSLRVGEQNTESGFIQRYNVATGGLHYLLQRNVRVMGEVGWDIERNQPRVTAGATLAW